jgi:2-dehydro-3-deoxyglucarate aldolase
VVSNRLRAALSRGDACIGSWLQIPSPDVAEIMAQGDFEWIAVDMEHGAFDWSTLPNVLRAIELGGAVPLVRLADQSPVSCARALDCGAFGLIVPNITTQAQVEAVIASSSWPPAGSRGVGFSRANGFGKKFKEYVETAQRPFIVAMIENVSALHELPQICNVPGLDAIFIGPYDLSASLGTPGDFVNPIYREALRSIIEIVKEAKVSLGTHIVDANPVLVTVAISEGFTFVAYSTDSIFLREASKLNLISN